MQTAPPHILFPSHFIPPCSPLHIQQRILTPLHWGNWEDWGAEGKSLPASPPCPSASSFPPVDYLHPLLTPFPWALSMSISLIMLTPLWLVLWPFHTLDRSWAPGPRESMHNWLAIFSLQNSAQTWHYTRPSWLGIWAETYTCSATAGVIARTQTLDNTRVTHLFLEWVMYSACSELGPMTRAGKVKFSWA